MPRKASTSLCCVRMICSARALASESRPVASSWRLQDGVESGEHRVGLPTFQSGDRGLPRLGGALPGAADGSVNGIELT